MRKFYVLFCMIAVLVVAERSATALEIQVAPQTLVLSSGGGKLTVHTDVPYYWVESVSLYVNGTEVTCYTFADDCGDLVAQCTRAAAAEEIGDFDGKRTIATITLDVDGDSASEDIVVKK